MRKGFQVALSIAISALLVGAALLALLTLLRGALSSEALRRALEALAASTEVKAALSGGVFM